MNELTRRTCLMLSALLALPLSTSAADSSFRKIVLTTNFYAEAASIADFNNDGHPDVVHGPFWYAGPDYKKRSAIYPEQVFAPVKYSNNFMTMVDDVNGDGYVDILVNEWPGKAVHWFANPKSAGQMWAKHVAHPKVDNESITYGNLTGDATSELIFHTGGQLGYAQPGSDPEQPWPFTAVSDKEKWGRYQHGLGFGDVNGDGRADFLMASGWWEQPQKNAASSTWKKHPANFGKGGAQMYTYDVDGDGDNDVITSLEAHGFGLAWFENVKESGKISFKKHMIMGNREAKNPGGACCSQLHAVCLVDMNGDGLKDIVTGKRWWAHGPTKDPEPNAAAMLYWFELKRGTDGTVEYVSHMIDDDSGIGTQFEVGDLNGDKKPDVVIGNKKGGFIFIQK